MKKALITAVAALLIGGVGYLVFLAPEKPGKYDGFAQCIKDSGTVFYGAFWCPHCQRQKGVFGRSSDLLPYVECSTPDGKDMIQQCRDAGIEAFPTWVFPDGTRETGELSFETLAAKTGCALPTVQ